MAYSQADLDALQAAIAKGARRLKLDGEEVEFRTLDEMERIEARIKAELAGTSRRGISYPVTSTGWR